MAHIFEGMTDKTGRPMFSPKFDSGSISSSRSSTVDPGFEINITGLTYRLSIDNTSSGGNAMIYDTLGNYGHGTDTAIGFDGVTGTTINGYRPSTATNFAKYTEYISGPTDNIYLQQSTGRIINGLNGSSIAWRSPADSVWTAYTTSNFNAFDPKHEVLWIRPQSTNIVLSMTSADSAPVSRGTLGLPASQRPLIAGNGFIATSDSTQHFYLKSSNDNSNFTNNGVYNSSLFDFAGNSTIVKDYDIDINGSVTYINTSFTVPGTNYSLKRLHTDLTIDNISFPRPSNTFLYLSHKNLSTGAVIVAYSCAESAMISGGGANRILIIDKYIPSTGAYSNIYTNNTTLKSTSTNTLAVKLSRILEVYPGVIAALAYSASAPYQDTVLKITL